MALAIGRWQFTPRFVPTLMTAIMLPVLLGLGTWQVERLAWKRQLLATISERSQRLPVLLPLDQDTDSDYLPGEALGTFRDDLTIYLLATSMQTGQGGYHVVTPMQLNAGGYVLVDRGWIPYKAKDDPKGYEHLKGSISIVGRLRTPPKPGWLTPTNNPTKGEWYSVDIEAISRRSKLLPMAPYILEAGPTADGIYPQGGQTRLDLPNNHLGYAITWYGFAVILTVIYVMSSFRRKTAN